MFKVENFGESWIDLVMPFPCEIHHCTPRKQPDPERFSVLTHYTEPRALKWPSDSVREFHGLFDLILTNEESLLDLPNAMFCLFGGSWVKSLPNSHCFGVSFLYSNGIGAEHVFAGYRDRREIWNRHAQIEIPTRFYTSAMRPPVGIIKLNPYPYPDKTGLFESMFSIIVENDYQEHFFTEKIIDCFRSYTVPIYFGAGHIGKYFNTDGMILPSTVDDMITKINRLSISDYWSRIRAIDDNYQRSGNYCDLLGRLGQYVEEGHRLKKLQTV